ncbi:leucyl/phenylalanyl-tRNA--protein transferase [Haematobacter missouriensis]|uniref:Leucyl/phenylalanyl-tRNA--protein transferase n=1 Tax=Haematobacter missouriensis TaxID=366616 RepID=A0A225D083_9RHOB|nr:leucyl/phenylalanyl-tRNA--protein transferase [Haematobacter missouriensis]OWJ75266.1 leucyl/phenylalanyl-tRNA--protein transferase [Haematobacter missouriensis]OWJ84499.1 leucyl/phenylalanyl-tRNA--protein transferase [Haematobacter missouriensis]
MPERGAADTEVLPLAPELLLRAYAAGLFPMADSREATELRWIDPPLRGVFSLHDFHISRSLARRIRSGRFHVTADRAFTAVMEGCADREETWINAQIMSLYGALHRAGHAHSIEVWEGEMLVGGVYGVTLGAAFFGESMFSRRTDASKVALAYLVDRLRAGGYILFDTQFLTAHLASLGAIEIPRAAYLKQLQDAIIEDASFEAPGDIPAPEVLLSRQTQ